MHPLSDEVPPEGQAVDAILLRLIAQFQDLVRDGIESGEFRAVSVPDTTQTLIGAAVFHFASGEFGEQLFGGSSLFSARAVERRRDELRAFFVHALVRDRARTLEESFVDKILADHRRACPRRPQTIHCRAL